MRPNQIMQNLDARFLELLRRVHSHLLSRSS
jgi:hypothetical protein